MKDTKVVIVTPQLPRLDKNGGIGTFVSHFSRLLMTADHKDLTIIHTGLLNAPRREWESHYRQQGIKVLTVFPDNNVLEMTNGYHPLTKISEVADSLIPEDADVVYFADFMANGLIPLRSRRYRARKTPVMVTVIHGPTEWHRQGQYQWPSTLSDLTTDFIERYVIEHSDFVATPSRYTFEWARQNSWKLPPENCLFTLGYPWLPEADFLSAPSNQPARNFKRIVFFGRIEMRKGIDLFINALLKLKGKSCLDTIEEIVLLGKNGSHIYGHAETAAAILREDLDISVTLHSDYDSLQAQQYLREHAADTLVVIPSRSETFGFTVIECSLIPGLNIICSNAGGIPEILKEAGNNQLFEPEPNVLAGKISDWLDHGPRPASELGQYDWQSANQRWLEFHKKVCEHAEIVKHQPVTVPNIHTSQVKSVDVCIPYYNLGQYLPYTLDSLDRQTTEDFNVFVIDDGSSDPESIEIFKAMKKKYQHRGWHFTSQENQGVCAARNLAAALGQAEYLIFVDSDNVAAPNMIERFLECIQISGDDCLTSWMYAFTGDHTPRFSPSGRGILTLPTYLYIPSGNYAAHNLLENPYGDINCIMRRSVFENVGGFTMDYPRYVNQEDRELLTILSLEGYKIDVIPEFLFFYRHRADSRLRSTDRYQNERRIVRVYEEKLKQIGLEDMAPLVLGLKYAAQNADTVNADNNIYRSEGGVTFTSQHEYLVNGVPWRTLLKAMSGKIQKNLRRLLKQ